MFFGYESEAQMREYNPQMADQIIAAAKREPMSVCSRHKQCVGSLDGKTYIYSDGSKDTGITVTKFRAELGGHVFAWTMENSVSTTGGSYIGK